MILLMRYIYTQFNPGGLVAFTTQLNTDIHQTLTQWYGFLLQTKTRQFCISSNSHIPGSKCIIQTLRVLLTYTLGIRKKRGTGKCLHEGWQDDGLKGQIIVVCPWCAVWVGEERLICWDPPWLKSEREMVTTYSRIRCKFYLSSARKSKNLLFHQIEL